VTHEIDRSKVNQPYPAAGGAPSRGYLVVAPGRNEAKYMRRTLDSLVAQTKRPALVIIVDDGSTDDSPRIAAEYGVNHDWIKVVTREDRGARSVGPGVMEAFYAGLDTTRLEDFDFICKLDLDLDLPKGYFEELMRRMEAEPRLGTCSGKAYYPGPNNAAESFDGELISEKIGDEVSVGASKFYRVSCFQQIGGFVRQVMWDGIDCHRCRLLGWIACSWDDPQLRFIHLRPMGSSQKGMWSGRMRWGYGQYFMGTSPIYMAASALYRMTRPPLIIGGLGMMWGYIKSWLTRRPRYEDLEFRRFLRQYQWEALMRGKASAAERAHRERARLWKSPAHPMSGVPSSVS